MYMYIYIGPRDHLRFFFVPDGSIYIYIYIYIIYLYIDELQHHMLEEPAVTRADDMQHYCLSRAGTCCR